MNLSALKVSNNYVRTYVPGRGYVMEHRLVMEGLLGRELEPEEQVHHKDKNKSNNDPSNLELCPDDKSHKQEHAYGQEELIRFLIMYIDEYAKWPTYKECAENPGMPHPSTFAREFGSWSAAKKAAKFELSMMNEGWGEHEEAFEEEI